ncbi:Starch-binding associating with outer membrane [Daejeonella rubra]|uniref:Starch-binding associating with outer membrane n=1 Tax=Daejeonella rubra TaxID=990371 RepID=A0A1G9PWS4_9SPHI|nr:RagB/SusD family nutrient uptake outer membrane protein [Daejeonella rubra]SDM03262.1 Starch-binding associating with outer membrane [Daejeonella rubra]
MNTKIKNITVLFLLVIFSAGCTKDFLSETNKSAITQENYFTTASQAQAAITGIYPMLHTFNQEIEFRGDAVWSLLEMPVGHIGLGGSQYKDGSIKHTNSANEPVYKMVWSGFYNGISNANLAIEKIPGITMNDAKKKSLLGEAYFLRALYYSYLVKLYGDIPLITKPINFSSPDLYPERSPKEKVYDLIVSDLLEAEKMGLPKVDNTGKASLGAVKSLLSGVYLTMAGYPLNKGNTHYQLAAAKAKEVLDGGYYKLFDSYDYLHDRAHKNKDELIFQVQYLAGVKVNRITEFISPSGISKLTSDLGTVVPIKEFVESYEANDKRTQEKQFYFTEDYARGSTTKIIKFAPALYKYWLEEGAGKNGDGNSDQNWTLLRLPEVMLIYAEASNEVEGPTSYAYDQINKIRTRANLVNLKGLTKDQFREAIWRERYHELAFENKAYFDIQRTRKVYNLKAGKFEDAFSYINESGVKFNQQYMLWPIPQSEIDVNKKLSPQNTGW